jgi:Fe-S cluster assembly scaffold IscU
MFRRVLTLSPRAAGRALPASTRPATRPATFQLSASIAATGRRQYHEKVLDHYSRPRNVGSMSKTDTDVGTGLVGAPACGDVMKLQIRVDPNNNTISDVKFKTFGCGSAIASSSYLTELVRGMTLEEAGRVRNTEIAKELCLPPVKRLYCHVWFSAQKLTLRKSTVPCLPRMPSSLPFPITTQRTPLLVRLI